ncbi:MAG: HAMP domain-containing sensor histidine kinase [Candidatus Korobacteraceae bacterium]
MAGSSPLVADLMLTFDMLDDPVILLHEDGRVIDCNHAATVLALPTKATAICSLHLLGPGEPWAACQKMLRDYQARSGWLEREVRDAGTGKCWDLRIASLGYLGVFPRRLVIVIRDITEAANIRERLREREVLAATGMLLAGAAHQAKNAIFGLSATLDAFEARFGSRAAADPYVESLRAGIARMQSLLRDLLDYGNRSESEVQPTSLSAVVRCSADACKALALKMGVTLTVDVAEDLWVMGDAPRLIRALENLLENAIQHSPQNGTVTLGISRPRAGDRGYCRCEVLDQGPGFPPEHIEKLFSPFFTRRPGGTGLGLTITKKIVEDAGGLIGLSNNREGGARVCLLLPASNHSEIGLRNDLSECDHGRK